LLAAAAVLQAAFAASIVAQVVTEVVAALLRPAHRAIALSARVILAAHGRQVLP
jgi:hypothetical protein